MNSASLYGLILLTLAAPCAWGRANPAATDDSGFAPLLSAAAASPSKSAQGYLGVSVRDVTPDEVAVLKLKDTHGAEIILVDHDAPAGKAGLREHDVVIMMNGQAIDGQEQLRRMLHESPPGRTIVLIVSRDGQLHTITTQMATQEEVEREANSQRLTVPEPSDSGASDASAGALITLAPSTPPPPARGNTFIGSLLTDPNYTGVMLETMSTQLADFFGATDGTGLLVRSVQEDSPGDLAGIRAGDVVIRANQRAVASTADWARAIKNSHGQPLAITILRDKKEQTVTLTPDSRRRSSLEAPQLPPPMEFAQNHH